MAYQPNPNDPTRSSLAGDLNLASDPYRENDLRDPARLDNELQVDSELAKGPASGGKIAMFAVAVALVLGAVFYGLNNSTINQAGTSSTAQNTNQSPPPAPPGMRDVTPRSNTEPGITTGAAPAQPAAAPTGNAPGK